ncbi:MAG: protein tyrosine phosphatase family protein [Rhodanobacteraceae bacterium]|nr:protein tyrosine phosphatase family protein [Rhodanobacteraceae bacterium]
MKRIPIVLIAALAAGAPAVALDAPNIVPISESLVTSGQPTRESLAALKSEGFEAVIYLAPDSVPDAIADEAEILQAQGVEFVHIPIVFKTPALAEVDQVAQTLERLDGRKVLVHCQVNMRASTVTFLYRAGWRGEDPATAYESVTRVWVPEGAWKELVIDALAARGVAFDPF